MYVAVVSPGSLQEIQRQFEQGKTILARNNAVRNLQITASIDPFQGFNGYASATHDLLHLITACFDKLAAKEVLTLEEKQAFKGCHNHLERNSVLTGIFNRLLSTK